ncbi:MAG: hypothetical protein IPP01_12690 [Saprospiraceae bacterium]|nr:hypothetical protein [Saprospiraceae bacterium]
MKTLLIKISLVIILYSSLITITPLLSQNIDSLFELSEKQHDLTKLKTLSEILHIVNPETHVNYLKKLTNYKNFIDSQNNDSIKLVYYNKIYSYHFVQLRFDSCKVYLDNYESIALRQNNLKYIALVHHRKAMLLGIGMQLDSSTVEIQKAISIYSKAKDYENLGLVYGNLATLFRSSDVQKAIAYAYTSIKYLEKICHSSYEARSHNNIGAMFYDLQMYSLAELHFSKAYGLNKGSKNNRAEVLFCNNLIMTLLRQQKNEQAKIIIESISTKLDSVNFPMSSIYFHINYANYFYNIQNFNLANQEIQYALTIHDKYNYGGEVLAMIKLIESKVMYHKMNFLKAIESTKIGLFNYQGKNTIYANIEFNEILQKSYSKLGNYFEANKIIKKIIDLELSNSQEEYSKFLIQSELSYNLKQIDDRFEEEDNKYKEKLRYERKKFTYISLILIGLLLLSIVIIRLYLIEKDQAKIISLNNKSTFDSNATLKQTNEELEESNLRLIKLANNISRQFEEPLQIINESSQKVVEFHKDDLSEEKIEQARRINSSSKRLKTMIQHLFNLSIIDGNVRFDQIPLNEIFTIVRESIHEMLEKKSGIIIFESIDKIVYCDKLLMNQVFYNIISNAIKYSRENISPFINVGVLNTNDLDFITIYIRDNGIGIAEDYFEYIFTPFKKIDHTDDSSYGIGLATSKRIIESLGGKIWVEAKLNVGSIFYFQIPVSNLNMNRK